VKNDAIKGGYQRDGLGAVLRMTMGPHLEIRPRMPVLTRIRAAFKCSGSRTPSLRTRSVIQASEPEEEDVAKLLDQVLPRGFYTFVRAPGTVGNR